MVGVYIFGTRVHGWYKIGMSRNIDRRFHDIQSAVPFPIEKIASWFCQPEMLRELERYLHEKFQTKRMNGEWFCLTEDEVGQCRRWMVIRLRGLPVDPLAHIPAKDRPIVEQLLSEGYVFNK